MDKIRYIICVISIMTSSLVVAHENMSHIIQKINSLPANTEVAVYEKLLKTFANAGGDIKEIERGILYATDNGNDNIISVVERSVLPLQNDITSLIEYYLHVGSSIGAFCNNPTKAIEYMMAAIDLAGKNNLNKKLFWSLDGQLNHAWGSIAITYGELNDYKNAALSSLKAAKEIKKFYPLSTKTFYEFLNVSSYFMYRHLSEIYIGNNSFGEYLPYMMDYSSTDGDLMSLSILWNYFIDIHDSIGLTYIETEIIPKEMDNKAIAEFYWTAAEQFQYDQLYEKAILYHLHLIMHSKLNHLNEYLYIEIDGIKHSRYEYIAFCYEQLSDNENSIQSILNALEEVALEFGKESKEFNYYYDYLCGMMEDPVKGPILQKRLNTMSH